MATPLDASIRRRNAVGLVPVMPAIWIPLSLHQKTRSITHSPGIGVVMAISTTENWYLQPRIFSRGSASCARQLPSFVCRLNPSPLQTRVLVRVPDPMIRIPYLPCWAHLPGKIPGPLENHCWLFVEGHHGIVFQGVWKPSALTCAVL